MKKLMTVLAGVATALFAFGAVGDVTVPPNGFESYTSGSVFDPEVQEGGSTYWYAASKDESNVISNYVESGTTVPTLATGVTRPDGMKENEAYPSNSKFLSLDTSTPLFRSVQANNQDGEFTGSTIGTDGIYLDTLVKFTAADDVFGDDALSNGVDKIAIQYVAREEETNTVEGVTTVTPALNNFVIRAGYITSAGESSVIVPQNYLANAPTNFDITAWHRLTVRTIANIGGGNVGFVVYVDQNPLAYSTNVACGDNFTASIDAQNFYSSEIHAVYPSAVASGATGGSEIAAASFSGTGFIDDVVFTTEPPEFIKNGEAVVVPFTVDAGVTAISVAVDGVAEPYAVDMTAENLTASLPALTAEFTVTATVNTADGYEFVSIKVGDTTYNENPASVTGYAGDTITITTVRNNFTYIDENDVEQSAGTLTAALAGVKAGGTIKLNYVYNLADYEGLPEQGTSVFTITKSCVLDLNGKTLNGGSSNDFYLFTPEMDCEFTVIDSATGGKIVYGGTKGIFNGNLGDVFIGSITLTDNGPTIDGSLMGVEGYVTLVWRGKFSATENTQAGAFIATLGNVQKCKAELDANEEYWVVTYDSGEEPPAPTTYELTIPTVTGASATVTDKATSSVIADLTAIEDGTVVTVTWTADSGYKITAGATEEITMDEDKTADEPTVVAITYATLTITPVENCTIVVSNATEEVATGATFDVDDAVELTVYRTPAEGYELDNCAATEVITMSQNQTVTAAVKQSGGGSDYPSYIEDITDPTEKAAYEKKYDTWATTYSVADGAGNEEAFLLNCAPADVETAKANFKIPSITVDAEGNVTVGTIEGTFNGKLQLKGSTDLKNWTNLDAASKDYNFFKYELTY